MTQEELLNQKINLFRRKAEVYQENETMVHVIIKELRKVYNGKIKKVLHDSFIIIDKKVGIMPILFEEVFKIEPYQNKK